MRRADRLFQIVQLLRRDRLTTAAALAREPAVNVRMRYQRGNGLETERTVRPLGIFILGPHLVSGGLETRLLTHRCQEGLPCLAEPRKHHDSDR